MKTLAVPLDVFEQAAKDPGRQNKMLNDGYGAAFARTLAGLRDDHFKDGKQKTSQRIAEDRRLAAIVENLAPHLSDAQSGALIVMINQYAQAQPKTELEDVITSFLLTEAKKKIGQGQ